jgi:hypothetical protein
MGIRSENSGDLSGYSVRGTLENGGAAWPVVITNNRRESARVGITTARLAKMPSGMQVKLYDTRTQAWIGTDIPFEIRVAAEGSHFTWVAAGSEPYFNHFNPATSLSRTSLLRGSPNPFRGRVRLNYTIGLEGARELLFTTFDHLGRVVWTRKLGPQYPGNGVMEWDARTFSGGSGSYLVRMSAVDDRGRRRQNHVLVTLIK